jgi:hypothetical protein
MPQLASRRQHLVVREQTKQYQPNFSAPIVIIADVSTVYIAPDGVVVPMEISAQDFYSLRGQGWLNDLGHLGSAPGLLFTTMLVVLRCFLAFHTNHLR